MTAVEVALPTSERARLIELETVVDEGLSTFVDVGRALAEINTSRLYRASHGTFVEYAADRFGIGKSHAYRMISAAKVADVVSPMGDIRSERQARELVGMPDNQARAAFDIAKGVSALLRGSADPNAEEVREARRRLEDQPVRIAADSTPEQARERVGAIRAVAAHLADDVQIDTATGEVTEDAKPPVARKPPRKPLGDAAQTAGWELRKAVERIERIFDDSRYRQNAEQVAHALRGHLLYAAETVAAVIDQLPSSEGV